MSIAFDILAAARSRLEALTLAGSPAIAIRKTPTRVEGDRNVIVISPGRETCVDDETDNMTHIEYEAIVTFFQPSNAVLEIDASNLLDWRQATRRALYTPLLGGTVYDCRLELNPPFDPSSLGLNADASQIRFFYKSQEARN